VFTGDAELVAAADRELDAAEADLAVARGRLMHARFLLRRETGHLPGAAANLVGLAYVAAAQKRSSDALALLDEAEAIARSSAAHRILQQVSEARAELSGERAHRPA
jgi:thioredoxin-like negative regulator of GroEL